MEYTFSTLLLQLTEGVSNNFKVISNSCLNIGFIKAIQANLCENKEDKILSKEAVNFILKEYNNQIQQFIK